MVQFDPTQREVLLLDPGQHAQVLGAPGSGKTRTLVEAFARVAEPGAPARRAPVALVTGRLAARSLRTLIERRLTGPSTGTPVRTPASFAYALLASHRTLRGEPAPTLITGAVQDEVLQRALRARGGSFNVATLGIPAEVIDGARFRAELREIWRVLDDAAITESAALDQLDQRLYASMGQAHAEAPTLDLVERWRFSIRTIEAARALLTAEHSGAFTASGMLRAASVLVAAGEIADSMLPPLLLVDDAQDFGEGHLALLAACAARGSRVWAFGDPDLAAMAFQGDRVRLVTELAAELTRRGGPAAVPPGAVPRIVLGQVHRHGPRLRAAVRHLGSRIGAAGGGEWRAAPSAAPGHREAVEAPTVGASITDGDAAAGVVRFVRAHTSAEQFGTIGYRMRSLHLGIDRAEGPLAWGEMALICRSRGEVERAVRALTAQQIPVGVAAGGLVLREHRLVRELITLLQHALALQPLAVEQLIDILGGAIGGLDALGVRRLRRTVLIQERRDAVASDLTPREPDEVIADAFQNPGARPIVDSAAGRALRRLALTMQRAVAAHEAGATPREVLWVLWEGAGLAEPLQEDALTAITARSDAAHAALDGVMGLFFALQRHEEQTSNRAIADLLAEILANEVAEDTLARQRGREEVIVTTPSGVVAGEFTFVALAGPQEGGWPNLRTQGSLLAATALERLMRGEAPAPPARQETLHDELRLFYRACSRAKRELLVVALDNEDQSPGPFFGLGAEFEVSALPSATLTLRGAVGSFRQRLERHPDDDVASHSLAALATSQVPGAHPDQWYGVLPPSSTLPLTDLDGDPAATVTVSPSQLERAEQCPLNWVIGALGGTTERTATALGTLVHAAVEGSVSASAEEIYATIQQSWPKLHFEADWEDRRFQAVAWAMADGFARYQRECDASGREVLAREAPFELVIGQARLRGTADRVELAAGVSGVTEISIVDLKTGATPPTGPETLVHAQLQAYQLGVMSGAFSAVTAVPEGPGSEGQSTEPDSRLPQPEAPAPSNAGARLLFVHPRATKGQAFIERAQPPLDSETAELVRERITQVSRVMAGARFEAKVEHHCTDAFTSGECRLHVIPAVSQT